MVINKESSADANQQQTTNKMFDYANLPLLVLNEIFGYLSSKDKIKAKAVCANWKNAIKSKDQSTTSLICHIGPYQLNRKWCWSKKMMNYGESFAIKDFEFFKRPLTRFYLKDLKRLNVFNYFTVFEAHYISELHTYFDFLTQLEELEISGVNLGEPKFNLPELKVLVLNKVDADYLELNCPKLETFVLWGRVDRINYKCSAHLKHMQCSNYGLTFSRNTKFPSLECLDLLNETMDVRDDLLKEMPNLKKLIVYPGMGMLSAKAFEKQKRRYGLNELEILLSGFDGLKNLPPTHKSETTFRLDELSLDYIFDNYTKLVEPVKWFTYIDYDLVFAKFRILPNNFFTKFPDISDIQIGDTVVNYDHLVEFLRLCPSVGCLAINLSKFQKDRPDILDQLFLLTPALRILIIKEDYKKSADYSFDYDLTFLHTLKIVFVRYTCSVLHVKFITDLRRHTNLLGFTYHSGSTILDFMLTIGSNEFGFFLASNEDVYFDGIRDFDSVIKCLKKHKTTKKYLI